MSPASDDLAWREDGACRGKPNHWWFPPGEPFDYRRKKTASRDVELLETKAVLVCSTCPVIAECRAWGVAHEPFGVWGGLTARARAQLRQRAGLRLEIGGPDDAGEWLRTRAIDLWRRGWRIDEIAEEVGENVRAIHRWLDAAGIEATPPPIEQSPAGGMTA